MFKTNRKTGQVFNDDKKRSDSHHGSVRPKTGVKTNGMKGKREKPEYKKIRVYTIDNAPKEIREKILEKHRDVNVSEPEMLVDGDWLLDYEIFDWNRHKVYYDLDRGEMIQFNDLKVKDAEAFRKMLGISKKLWDEIDYKFVNDRDDNTRIEFFDPETYDEIEEGHDYNHEKLSKSDLHEIDDAREKFSDMIHKSWVNLRDTYESSMDDENVAETLRINDYKFDEYGDIA